MFWPTSSRRSFQFMHATWQALQPMHLDSSISLAICGDERTWDEGVVVAERATTFWGLVPAMVVSLRRAASRRLKPPRGAANKVSVGASCSCLLDVDEERLELRRLRVGVADERSQCI